MTPPTTNNAPTQEWGDRLATGDEVLAEYRGLGVLAKYRGREGCLVALYRELESVLIKEYF